jgi:prepilin peptidase CpaA
MKFYSLEYWPIHVICVGMIAAAVIDWWKYKVPNKLTFPLIISGWVLGLANNFGLGADHATAFGLEDGHGGLGSALVGTFLGLGLMLPVYAIGGMGAGDVKMTMGFGSWIGAFFGMANGSWIIVWAFCAGTIVGGVIALGMIMVRGNYKQNVQNVREIVGDVFQSSSVGEIADKANRRRPRWHRLPYGVPLCIGFLGCLVYLFGV